MVAAATPTNRQRARSQVGAYVALTKPRIIELLLVTTVPTQVVAERGIPSVWLMVATVLGGTLAAGGANAINMYVDRDIDKLMKRTAEPPAGHRRHRAPQRPGLRHRPRGRGLRLPVGHGQPAVGRARRGGLPVLRLRLHAVAQAHVEPQHRHRRRRRRRAGAHRLVDRHQLARLGPDRAVRGDLLLDAAALLGRWPSSTRTTTPPPTCRCSPSWPTTAPPAGGSSPTPWCSGRSPSCSPRWPTWASPTSARPSCLGGIFTFQTVRLFVDPTPARAMRVFGWSITYVTLLFGAMAVDQLVRTGV